MKYFISILLLLIACNLYSQTPYDKCEKIYAAAETLFEKGDYSLAIKKISAYKICANATQNKKADGFLLKIYETVNNQKIEAERQKKIALRERNKAQANYLILEAKSNLPDDPTLALRLVEASQQIKFDPQNEILSHQIYHENSFYKIIKSLNTNIDDIDIRTGTLSAAGNSVLFRYKYDSVMILNTNKNLLNKFATPTSSPESNDVTVLSPDGKSILTAWEGHNVQLRDIEGELIHDFNIDSQFAFVVTFSSRGDYVLTYSYYRKPLPTIKIWHINGNFKGELHINTEDPIYAIALSPDERFILTGGLPKDTSNVGKAQLWNMDGTCLREFRGHSKAISCLEFAPDGKSILTGSYDNTAIWWSLETNKTQLFKGHKGEICSVKFSPDSTFVLTLSSDQTVRIWKINNKKPVELKREEIFNNTNGFINHTSSATFSPDGKFIQINYADDSSKVWTLPNDSSLDFNPIGQCIKTVITPNVDNLIASNEKIKNYCGYEDFEYLSDKRHGVLGLGGKKIQIFNLNCKNIFEDSNSKSRFSLVALTPDDNNIFTSYYDGTSTLREVKNKKVITTFNSKLPAIAVGFSTNAKYICMWYYDSTARLWSTDGKIIDEFKGNSGHDTKMVLTSDGKFILIWSHAMNNAWLWKRRMPLNDFLKSNYIEPLSKTQKEKFGIK